MSILLLAAGLVLGPAEHGPALQMAVGTDSTAIHRLWAELDATWGERDPDAFVRFFTTDASFALVDRDLWLEGRDSIHRHFVEQFRRQRPELRHVTEIERLRRLPGGAVALDGEVRIVDGGSGDDLDLRRLAITVVMVDGADGWRIQLLRAHTLHP